MAQDWIRFPFEVSGRVHDGPDAPIVRIRWAYTHLPFPKVGTPRVILNRKLNLDQISDERVGQLAIFESNYKQDARWKTPADLNGAHQCHPEWLATGEPWPNDLPPTVYMTDGVPVCCRQDDDPAFGGLDLGGAAGDVFTPNNVLGGFQMGGTVASTLVYVNGTNGGLMIGSTAGDLFQIADPAAGGLALGGAAGDLVASEDAAAGGLALGGEAGDEGTIVIAPGLSCTTATAVVQNQFYFRSGGPGVTSHWYVFGVSNGNYSFTWQDTPSSQHSTMRYFVGPNCSSLGAGTTIIRGVPNPITVTNNILFLQVSQASPGVTSNVYYFKLT